MDNTVLITGCSSGIGRETALYFAEKGWKVLATSRDKEKMDKYLTHKNITTRVLDVTNHSQIQETVEYVKKNIGSIHCLVNNAGYGAIGPFELSTTTDVTKQFGVNVFGVMDMTRAFLPLLRATKGSVVSVSSIAGRMSFPLFSLYHSTKWALEGFMESVNYELQHQHVRVRLVEPGPIQSEFNSSSQHVIKTTMSVYNSFVDRVYPKLQSAGFSGGAPIDVAKVIYIAANSRSSKLRYGVGEARILLCIRKILPDWLFRIIVKMIFNI